jgi:hypothetical protein
MDAWLPIILVAVTQVALRLITVVWRERARAQAHRIEMAAAAASGATLCELRGDGTGLLIIPPQQPPVGPHCEQVIIPGEKVRL